MAAPNRPRVFLEITIGNEPAGRLTIELFTDQTPKTCEKYEILSFPLYTLALTPPTAFARCVQVRTRISAMPSVPSTASLTNSWYKAET